MSTRKARQAGFTLIELMVVVAVIAVLAAMGVAATRWVTRNASVDAASDDLVVQLAGLQGASLSDGRDRVFVLVDRGAGSVATSARTFVLAGPAADWKLSSFDPARPGLLVLESSEVELPRRAQLLNKTAVAAPAPLQAASIYDPGMLTTCGGVSCFALRFTADGEVIGEAPDGGNPGVAGFGFVIGDVEDGGSAAGAKRRGVVVGFPTGVVKSYVP